MVLVMIIGSVGNYVKDSIYLNKEELKNMNVYHI